MMRFLNVLWLGLTMLTLNAHGQTQKTGIQVTDLLKIKSAGSVILSPTEDFALYSVRSVVDADRRGEYDYHSQWWILRFEPELTYRPLTSGKEGFSSPQISPDGSKILFSRSADGKSQLFVMHMDGGDPIQLTRFKHGAGGAKWSPDGSKIVFSASFSVDDYYADKDLNPDAELPLWSFEKPGFEDNSYLIANDAKSDPNGNLAEIRAYLKQNEKDRKAKVFTKLRFQSERATSNNMSVSHLFVVDAEGKEEPKMLTSGFYSFSGAHFKNNNTIWFSGRPMDDIHPDRAMGGIVYSMHLDGTGFKELFNEEGMSIRMMAIAEDGDAFAYSRSHQDSLVIGTLNVHYKDAKNQKHQVEIDLDRSISGVQFDPTGEYVYMTVGRNGGTVLYRYGLNNGNTEKLTSDDVGINSYVVGSKRLLYAQTDINNPSELYLADRDATNARRVTDLNTGWLAEREIAPVEKRTFVNELGMEVEYWVMKPLGAVAGQKYPLVLQIHGGPASMWGPGVSSMWHEYQYFAAQGYGTVYANPRGSSGYGVEFLQGNYRDWGTGPASDVLTALDLTVAQGWADPAKLLITGGSYAGYLTNWIISHDHRFLAASAQRGVYHLTTFFGEGNASSLVPRYFGGYPWEPSIRKILEEQSPYNYVHQIETPFLIFHGEVDLRTGVIQSEMLYKSLKQLGKPVEYVRHPNGDHELTRSGDNRQRIDQMLRTYEFFERYVNTSR